MYFKMKSMLFRFLLACSLLLPTVLDGQEFNARVTVLAPNVSTADPEIFKEIERTIDEFINGTKWTGKSYEPHEKIEATIQLTITQDAATTFTADLIIKAVRPVYNSGYQSPLINHVDKGVTFTFQPGTVIQRSEQTFTSNLSSILTFYAYMILGIDADTYELYGGTDYFNTAQNVLITVPQGLASSDPGWESGRQANRTSFIETMINARLRPFRQAVYEYHRQGLDMMTEDRGRARAIISSNITQIADVNQSFPYAHALKIFAYSKREELVRIFDVAPKGQRKKVYNTFVAVDPILAEALKKLNQ